MSYVQPTGPVVDGGQPARSNGLATAGLVLGIIAVIFSFIPLVNVIVWPLAILGLIFGAIGLAKSGKVGKGKGASITALVTSLVSVVMFFVMNAVFVSAVDEAVKETQNELDKSYDSAKVDDDGNAKTGEGTDENPVLKDFRLSKCDVTTSEWGSKELALHIDYTNNGDRRYSYFLEGEVLADGKKISDFLSTAENLAPGQTFKDEDAGVLVSSDKLEGAKKLECKVIEANRHDF
ncbi:putative membrane protein [Streptomyces sp. V4I23]|uniref:DUF4190 domain-containing protein n=1 Tax=Streptomyces sp. V4I23 TaxID=3042282 RepID=UPI00277D306B|nr:DUF4190 domain-containing protein [Streptomyces sp. V4I23]MDQ1007206.1 putative membrane protein [Streptomyces sp. V4I23]